MIDKNMLNQDNKELIMVEAVVRMTLIECNITTPEKAMVCKIDRFEEDIRISHMPQRTIDCNAFVTINNETYKFHVALMDPETETWQVKVFKRRNTDKFNDMVCYAIISPKRDYLVNKEIPSIDVYDLDNINIDKIGPISYSTILDAMKRCNNPYFEIINQGSPVGMSTLTKPISLYERYIIAWDYALIGDKVNSFATAHPGSLYLIGTDKNIYWLSIENIFPEITLAIVKKYINPNCDEVIYQARLNIIEHGKSYDKSTQNDTFVDHENVKKKDDCISPKTTRISKTEYYLSLAEVASKRGTCLRRKFGAVIVKDDRIVSTGYAGAPRGRINCCDRGVCARVENNVPAGERYELCRSVHAEANAIINASIEEMSGSTLYLVGIENDGSFTKNAEPCAMCKRMIINAGIKKVIVRMPLGSKEFLVKEWVDNDDSLDFNHKGY